LRLDGGAVTSLRSWLPIIAVGVLVPQAACSEPPSIEGGLWSHIGPENDLACTGTSEIEPNGDVATANVVSSGECSAHQIKGSVSNDIDVFRADGQFCDGSSPTASFSGEKDMRLCIFVVCAHGKTGISGCDGDKNDAGQLPVSNYLPAGMRGCCRVGPGRVTVLPNCDGQYAVVQTTQPEWHTYFVLDRIRETSCSAYTVDYHF
jgi:hypothetical protein